MALICPTDAALIFRVVYVFRILLLNLTSFKLSWWLS